MYSAVTLNNKKCIVTFKTVRTCCNILKISLGNLIFFFVVARLTYLEQMGMFKPTVGSSNNGFLLPSLILNVFDAEKKATPKCPGLVVS